MPLSDILTAHSLTAVQFDRFLRYLGGSVVDLEERDSGDKRLIVTVEASGETHGYSAEDIRVLAARCCS